MAYVALAKLKKNSVGTTIAAPGIADDAATIPVSELAYFRDADGTLITRGIVIGYDDANQTYSEEITITGASGSSGAGNLTGATRGVNADGTIGQAKAWDAGTSIAVMVSTGIYNIIKDNFAAHESDKAPLASPTFTGTATIPTLDTGVAAAGVTLAGTTLAADGTDENIDINITPKGTGSVVVSKADINGGAVDGATIGAASASTAVVTTLKVTTDAAAGKVLVSDADGDLVYTLATRTLVLSGAGGYPATTLPDAGFLTVECGTNDVDYRGTKFAHSADALSYHVWSFPMPENYDGSTMTAEFYWTTNTESASGDIRWVIQMLIRGNDDPIDAAWGTAVGVTDTILAVNDQHISATSGAITPAGTPAGGKKLFVRVARDFENGDTSTADAILTDVYLHYGTDHYSDV